MRMVWTVVVMAIALGGAAVRGQNLDASPELVERAVGMFAEARTLPGPFRLEFKADFRLHAAGFEARRFMVVSGDRELGAVNHVKATAREGLAGQLEYLVRYDDQGRVLALVTLTPIGRGAGTVDMTPLNDWLRGRDPRQVGPLGELLCQSVATVADLQGVKAPPGPPPGTVVNLRGKILEPGTPLPPLQAQDLQGNVFDAAKMRDKPLVLVFTSPRARTGTAMVRAVEDCLLWPRLKDQFHVAYIISGPEEDVRAYAAAQDLGQPVIADSATLLSTMFKVPFKPYALLFNREGTLEMNLFSTDRAKVAGHLFRLLGVTPTDADVPDWARAGQ